jgi:ankyrin repeat protein
MSSQQPPAAGSVQTRATARRFYVVARGIAPLGYDMIEVAINVARQYGEGTDIVDTLATPYHPMVQRIEAGEPVYLEYGAWPTQRAPDQNLIEAAKKGCPAIVSAFLAKGADVNVKDSQGGTALTWSVARRVPDSVRLLIAAGANVNACDHAGMSALKLARAKNLPEIVDVLVKAGAYEDSKNA